MARIFTESFEAQHFLRFTATNSPSIVTGSTVDGVAAVSLTGNQYVEKTLGTALSEAYFGFFAMPITTSSQIQFLQWRAGATELGRIQQNTVTKVIEAVVNGSVVASSSNALVDSTVYHLQVRVQIADAGVIQVKLDDTQVINFSGDTKPGADTTFDVVRWGGINGVCRYDTLTVNDTTGGVEDSWPGVARIQRMLVTGPGNYVDNWSRNTGATNWEAVDEVPHNSDTDYLFTTTANLYESFSMADQALTSANYRALITSAIAKKDSGTVQLAIGIRDNENATDYWGANSALATSYGVVEERRTTDPSTGTTWTSTGINSTEALISSTA